MQGHLELHQIAILDSITTRIRGVHVYVPSGANDALLEFDHTVRTNQHTTRRAFDVSAVSNWSINPKRNRVGECELHLAEVARRAEYTDGGQCPRRRTTSRHPPARDGHDER